MIAHLIRKKLIQTVTSVLSDYRIKIEATIEVEPTGSESPVTIVQEQD